MSSNAMTIRRRQNAEPFCAKNVSGGSLRDLDFASADRFLKEALDHPLICNEGFDNSEFTNKPTDQSIFCLEKCVAHRSLRAVKCTVDVNFERREAN